MKRFLIGPSGQIFALICISFGAGTAMMTALQSFLRGNASWMIYAGLTALMCMVIGINAVRLRNTVP